MSFNSLVLFNALDDLKVDEHSRLSFEEVEDEISAFKISADLLDLKAWNVLSTTLNAARAEPFKQILTNYLNVVFSQSTNIIDNTSFPVVIELDLTRGDDYLKKWGALNYDDIYLVKQWVYEKYIPNNDPERYYSPLMLKALNNLEMQLLNQIVNWQEHNEWSKFAKILTYTNDKVFYKIFHNYLIFQATVGVRSFSLDKILQKKLGSEIELFNSFKAKDIENLKNWLFVSFPQEQILRYNENLELLALLAQEK